uniref:Uncharacterized protein n=1 Tax=Strigamia maritima TaxID=126957 RepID=T1II24_STRMM
MSLGQVSGVRQLFVLIRCNGVSDVAMKSFGLIPFDHDARRCLLRAGNRTDFT